MFVQVPVHDLRILLYNLMYKPQRNHLSILMNIIPCMNLGIHQDMTQNTNHYILLRNLRNIRSYMCRSTPCRMNYCNCLRTPFCKFCRIWYYIMLYNSLSKIQNSLRNNRNSLHYRQRYFYKYRCSNLCKCLGNYLYKHLYNTHNQQMAHL